MQGELTILATTRMGAEITHPSGEYLLAMYDGNWQLTKSGGGSHDFYRTFVGNRRISWSIALARALDMIDAQESRSSAPPPIR